MKDISLETVFVNIGYILMLLALVVRDMLMLRSILMSGQMFLVFYCIMIGNYAVAFYNSIFFLINTIQVIRLIRERRPIDLSEELENIYCKLFTSMKRREFLLFWNMGTMCEIPGGLFIKEGENLDKLYLILNGSVDVIKDNILITSLSRGSFIAEMSFLTGEPATADIIAKETVQYISWNQDKLRHMDQLQPELLIKIQNILGKDLVNKLKTTSSEEELTP